MHSNDACKQTKFTIAVSVSSSELFSPSIMLLFVLHIPIGSTHTEICTMHKQFTMFWDKMRGLGSYSQADYESILDQLVERSAAFISTPEPMLYHYPFIAICFCLQGISITLLWPLFVVTQPSSCTNPQLGGFVPLQEEPQIIKQ